jgi:hypothetical protein
MKEERAAKKDLLKSIRKDLKERLRAGASSGEKPSHDQKPSNP